MLMKLLVKIKYMIIKFLQNLEIKARLRGLACSRSVCCSACSIKKTKIKRLYCLALCSMATKLNNLIDKI